MVATQYLELGGMCVLFTKTVVRAFRPPFSYGPELIAQFRFTLKTCLFPLLLVSFALSFGPAGVQASNFFGLFGSFDRMGSIWQIVVTREFAPLTTAIVLAGTAGTAMCADLGARVVREEVDALNVLGVDTIKHLVVPRVIVVTLCAVLFNTFAMVAGMAGAVLVLIQNHQSLAPFFSVFFANADNVELTAAFAKAAIFGVVIAVVSCYKGLTVKGGAEDVGKAVNQAVVIAFLAIAAIDYVFTSFVLAHNPILTQPKG